MTNIDIDNLPLKYITGSYRYDRTYPSDMDFLYDLVQTGKGGVKLDSIDWIGRDTALRLCESLCNDGFAEIRNGKINVIKTPWDE